MKNCKYLTMSPIELHLCCPRNLTKFFLTGISLFLVVLFCVSPDQKLPEHDSRTIIVHTKGDIDSSHQDAISADQLIGLEELKEQVAKKLRSVPSPHHNALALLPRHESHISETIVCLNQAKEDAPVPELVANSLRSALNEIGCITGAVTPDEVLGKVFASFCVGK